MTVSILVGDCIESMRTLSDESINCCVTSPPYYGLRDYGVKGQIGLEDTPEAYISKLVDVFRGHFASPRLIEHVLIIKL